MKKEDIDRIASEYFDNNESEHEMEEVFDLAKKALEEQKEGVWIDKFAGVYRCSCCREIIEIDIEIDHPNGITFNYCPNCGAKMVDPQESEGVKE